MKTKNLTEWRNTVLERDNYTCQIDGEPANTADHVKPRSLAPELALETDNGRALCRSCHSRYGVRADYASYIHSTTRPTLIVGLTRIHRVGGSLIFILPPTFVALHNIKEGDELPILANHILKIVPMSEEYYPSEDENED